MENTRASVALSILIIAIAAALATLGWINYKIISSSPTGESFLTYWVSTRAFLKTGSLPYRPELPGQIQQQAAQHDLPITVQKEWLAFPLYLETFIIPFALTDQIQAAQVAWMIVLEIAVVLIVFASARTAGWGASLFLWPALFLFALFWFFSVRSILSGSISVIVGLLVALAFWALKSDLDELCGLLLALSTIQPGPVILLVAFTLIWAISSRRGRLFVWLAGGILLLIGVSSLFGANWTIEYARLLLKVYPSTEILTPQAVFQFRFPGIGSQMGLALTILVGLVLVVEWWLARGKGFRWYFWTACLTLALTPWTGIPIHQEMFVVLLIPLVLVFATMEEAWGTRIRWLIVLLMFALVLSFWIPYISDLSQVFISGRAVFMFTLPALVLLGLFWVRWHATRPRKLLIAELKAREI